MKRILLFAALAVAVCSASAVAVNGANGAVKPERTGDERGGDHGQAITGTWVLAVSFEGGAPFEGVITFSPGGGVLEIETTRPGTSIGAWESRGRNRVAFTLVNYRFNAENTFTRRAVVRTEVAVRGDTFSGPFTLEVRDTQGNLTLSGRGTATATRLRVSPR